MKTDVYWGTKAASIAVLVLGILSCTDDNLRLLAVPGVVTGLIAVSWTAFRVRKKGNAFGWWDGMAVAGLSISGLIWLYNGFLR